MNCYVSRENLKMTLHGFYYALACWIELMEDTTQYERRKKHYERTNKGWLI